MTDKHELETSESACHLSPGSEEPRERFDKNGNRWVKVYTGAGEHFKNWLEQCRQLGEVEVEEANTKGLKCFEGSGEKAYTIWLRIKTEK